MHASRQHDIHGAILYGSRARGTQKPGSDVDLAILLPGKRYHFWPILKSLSDTAIDVLLETDADILVEAFPIWEDEWEHPENYSNPALLRAIAREGIRL